MAIFNFSKKLSNSEKEDFNREILEVNHVRARNLSLLLIVISVISIFVMDKTNLQKGLENVSLGYRWLFYLHVILGITMLITLSMSLFKLRLPFADSNWWGKVLNFSFCLTIVIIGALFSVNDQLIDGKITVYILSLFVVAMINYFHPVTSLIIYLSSFIIFVLGITKFQTDSVILKGEYVNSAIILIIAWFMSSILYYSKVTEFVDRRTIKRQRDQLEQANFNLSSANIALRESLRALDESQDMIFSLAMALESKDKYTRGHSERVAEYALVLADHLGLNEEDKKSLWGAAILHDIGKIGIPDAILNKSSRLSDEEWEVMKTHPERGEVICSKLKFAKEILPIIRHHHERYDGTGYPDRLKGENIPFLARIVAIADMVDAVTSERSYRLDQTLEASLLELERNLGTQFDPVLAKAFVNLHKNKTSEAL